MSSVTDKSICQLIELQASRFSAKPAIIFRDHPVSFSQLRSTVFSLADSLSGHGIKKGDKVAIYLPNWPEYVYSYLALFVIGATVVPLDYMLKADELEACLRHSGTRLLIAKSREDVVLEALKADVPSLKDIMLVHEKKNGFLSFEEFVERGTAVAPAVSVADDDAALIMYTSGSTGRPKGVMLSYRHLSASPKAMEYFVDLTPADIKLSALPLSHAGGLVYLQNCLFFGITLVMMERFIPVEFLKNVEKYRVTCFHLVPSLYYALLQLKEFEKYDLSSIRWVNVFGAPNSPDAIRRFKTYCPKASLLNGWGMTETNAPNMVIPMGSDKIESIGRPAPWIEVRLVDEAGKTVPEGEIGEITLKSWVVMKGYYQDPEMTVEVIKEDWLYTGDLARRDKDGLYYIVGRKRDMIKVSGQLVFPSEVEEVLHKHPRVSEAAVIGIPDQMRGELVKAFVVVKDKDPLSIQDIRDFCRAHLAHFKMPHDIQFMDALPKNRAGKVDKVVLKQPVAK